MEQSNNSEIIIGWEKVLERRLHSVLSPPTLVKEELLGHYWTNACLLVISNLLTFLISGWLGLSFGWCFPHLAISSKSPSLSPRIQKIILFFPLKSCLFRRLYCKISKELARRSLERGEERKLRNRGRNGGMVKLVLGKVLVTI